MSAVARDKRRRESRPITKKTLMTPEGVPIELAIARVGDRAAALALDLFFLFAGLVLVVFVGIWLASVIGTSAFVFAYLAMFFLRNGYFIAFELLWNGRTPGKRIVGLRVVDRYGGALRAEAIFARNLLREVELWVPLGLLVSSEQLFGEAPGWLQLLAITWIGCVVLMPIFNRERLRPGDLIAGTLVIIAPKAELKKDLTRASAKRPDTAGHTFSDALLNHYGVFELQTLEEILRKKRRDAAGLRAIAKQIRKKIGYRGRIGLDADAFLRAFYNAQRAHLEKLQLHGERREDKRAARRQR